MSDTTRSNYHKVTHRKPWTTIREVVEHFRPDKTYEQVLEEVKRKSEK